MVKFARLSLLFLMLIPIYLITISCRSGAKEASQPPLVPGEYEWVTLQEGLEFGQFKLDSYSLVDDSILYVLRISPQHFKLKLLAASALDSVDLLDAHVACEFYGAVTAINAGMFEEDYTTHTGYMSSQDHVNNPAFNNTYHSFAVFNPKRAGLPEFDILDRGVIPLDSMQAQYHGILQNLRLIKKPGENAWKQQPRRWSEASLAQDDSGNILFVFCRSPYSMHDFNTILLELPLGIVAAQHLEGGPEAQVCIRLPNGEYWDWVGSFETDFTQHNQNHAFWGIPNVLAIEMVDKKTD